MDASMRTRSARWVVTSSARLPASPPLSEARRAVPWRALFAQATGLWLITRIAYLTLTYFFSVVTLASPDANVIPRTPMNAGALLLRWAQWDGGWYRSIAQMGYASHESTAFFPLYPMLIRGVAALIGPHWALAALLVSNVAALFAFGAIAALAAQVAKAGDELRLSRRALALFAAYPLAFFLAAAYSDGLFVALVACAMTLAMRRHWGWVTLVGLLAGLCRPTAPALVVALAWEALQHYRVVRKDAPPLQALRSTLPALGATLAPLAGIGLYSSYLWARFGNPLLFVSAATTWRHLSLFPALSVPVAILTFASLPFDSPLQARIALDLLPILGGIVITLVGARRSPLTFTLYLLAYLYLVTATPISFTDLFVSGGRYMLAAVPICIILATRLTRAPWVLSALRWCGVFLQALLALYFLSNGWMV